MNLNPGSERPEVPPWALEMTAVVMLKFVRTAPFGLPLDVSVRSVSSRTGCTARVADSNNPGDIHVPFTLLWTRLDSLRRFGTPLFKFVQGLENDIDRLCPL